LAGVLLKHALEKEGLSYETLKFNKTVEGKPFLESNPNLHFSISHAGEYVVCAISDKPVGVDIESIDRDVFLPGKLQRLDAMAQKCLSENEMKKFIQSNEVEKKELFIKYWTRKEAYSKVIGKGIGMDFSTIDTETDSMRYKSNWIKEGYMLSICMMN